MTSPTEASNHATIMLHLNGPQDGTVTFRPANSKSGVPFAYGTVCLDGGPVDLNVFVHDRGQATALAAMFASLALQFGEPEPADARGAADALCGDRNLCARPYRHADGPHRSFSGTEWPAEPEPERAPSQ